MVSGDINDWDIWKMANNPRYGAIPFINVAREDHDVRFHRRGSPVLKLKVQVTKNS